LSVLLVRAIFIVNLPIQELALAIGICGWLFLGKERQEFPPKESQQESIQNRAALRDEARQPKIQNQITEIIGAILLLIAWSVGIGEKFPWQAMAVSLLALHFFTHRLRRDWLRRDLFAVFTIGWQSLILIGRLIPKGFSKEALDLSIQIADSKAFPWTVYGITLFPYVIFMVWLTGWLYRQEKQKLALFGEWLTLSLGVVLTILSLLNPTWRSLNLFCSTATLVYVVQYRLPLRVALLYFTHLIGLLAFSNAIAWWFPSLPHSAWASLFLGLAVVEWGVSTLQFSSDSPMRQAWCRSCWHFGFVLASLSYALLWERVETFFATNDPQLSVLFWAVVPVTLTGVAMRVEQRRREAPIISSIALIFAQTLTLWQPETRSIGFGIASGLMFANSIYLRHLSAAVIQIGFSLCFVAALLWEKLSVSDWFFCSAIAILSLWLLSTFLRQKQHFLASLYSRAADRWAVVICAIELVLLSCKSLFSYLFLSVTDYNDLFASLLIGIAILYRYRQQLNNWSVYGIAWTVELAICQEIILMSGSELTVAIANIILGFLTLWLSNWLSNQQSYLSQLNSLKILPLLFALLSIIWRWNEFTAYTGLLTIGAALTGISVGYHLNRGKIITYVSLACISIACYELVIYQMLKSSEGSPADGLTILAIVAAAIALFYRIYASFLQSREITNFLNLSLSEIKIAAHTHWVIGSIFKILAAGVAVENTPRLRVIGIFVSAILATYALIQGRDRETRSDRTFSDWWVYVGLVELIGTTVYARLIWEQLSILDPFRVILVCIVALFIYQIPWQSLGWESTPWHRFAIAIPSLSILVTIDRVSYISLFVVAAFYLRIALRQREIRWTYISLGFIDWAIARFLLENKLTDILYFASIVGLSLLYIAQFDRTLKQPQQRGNRHFLRVSGSGIICIIALLFHQETGLIPTVVSLLAIFLGLGLQIRAFLFMGTITFVLTGFYQLIVLSFEYPLAKWIVGLIAGIIFIIIAANFEKRREDITRLLQNWLQKLERWE
jgi:hypothetical protein